MNKFLKSDSPIIKISLSFLIWRVLLILISIIAIRFVSLAQTDRFLGGGPVNYQLVPQLFSWANFDGEHYLSISIFGYKSLEQAFFPVYPIIISFMSKPFSHDLLSSLINSTIAGLIISNSAFLMALIVLYKLIQIDFSKEIAFLTILLLLIFPTAFYFGALYSESLFILFSVISFYNARKRKWLIATIFGILASGTRVFGSLLLPSLIIEALLQKEKFSKFFWIILIPLGLILYMIYQYLTTGDILAFYHLQRVVGEQHQSGLSLLPQVYFRYAKMILTVDKSSAIYQTIWLELLVGILFFILPILGYFKKIRFSYLFYALSGFLLPTVQGSFSSLPRYVIVLFPSFLIFALLVNSLPKIIKVAIIFIFSSLFLIETTLFLRGYWVA